jgi:formamidopyrimidine-DNA glycosylase
MPELPEVETARRILARELADAQIADVIVRLPKLLRDSPIQTLEPLKGQRIAGARRRAKVLIVDFSNDLSLMIHLKLAGQVAVIHANGERHVAGHPIPKPDSIYPHKATHVEVHFENGTIWYLSDIRQFGWLRLMPTTDVEDALAAFRFGPEAVGPEMIDVPSLQERLARRSIPIKLALLDQTLVAGLGNIYVDEALHKAGIYPGTPANTLTANQISRLHDAMAWALERGIEQGGAKIIHGKAYPIDGFPRVHAREHEPCLTCGTEIIKIRVGTRGTYYCPVCQPEP